MKRSPLRRKTKLHQGKTRLRRTALRRVGKRREREAEALAEFSRKLIPLALCSECRRNDTLDAHHLCSRARGAGHPKLHDKRNRAWLCRPCHEAAHRGDLPHLIKSRDYLDTLQQDDRPE